ncbi:TrkH family potassium uptake protein [Nocardioides euryhalodurans]|uniref:TrkH family potassium uptake protein n=2 Tax=Nocardioides euryhalodurans TaxID=2518370 RepID=A0A4P7GQR8_9ACTN|nr:TrkH family potassium uptake protein [Nocardioides euryhalodurans]
MLPFASEGPGSTDVVTALFTSTSAVCVTGLVVVDTASHWTTFGEVVILGLIQLGGIGIMTFASVVGLLISRRMGLRTRLSAAAETKAVGLADLRRVVTGVVTVSLLVEALVAVVLFLRFWLGYDEPVGRAAYLGVFHSVSAFNNAGFALYADSLVRFVTDPWVCVPIALAVIFGGLGFPVWFELRREIGRPRAWSMHTKMTVSVTAVLLVAGTVFVTASEWSNPDTLGAMSAPGRIFAGFFHAVMPRTAGFNSLDVGAMNDSTLLGTIVLMFIGGGSAGTAGGIKVTTFILLFFVIYAEVRGEERVNAFDRQVDDRVIRQALTVALLSVGAVVGATLLLMSLTGLPMGPVLFEATSAFATVGLSTGITFDLPTSAELVLVGLMFLGRLGPITLVSALALRERHRHYELPEGRPIIG